MEIKNTVEKEIACIEKDLALLKKAAAEDNFQGVEAGASVIKGRCAVILTEIDSARTVEEIVYFNKEVE